MYKILRFGILTKQIKALDSSELLRVFFVMIYFTMRKPLSAEKTQRLRLRAELHHKNKRKKRKSTIKPLEIQNISDNFVKGIYFLIKNDSIVYVGQSKDSCISRISDHYRDMKKDFDSFRIMPLLGDSDSQINFKERNYIKSIKPIYNIIHN